MKVWIHLRESSDKLYLITKEGIENPPYVPMIGEGLTLGACLHRVAEKTFKLNDGQLDIILVVE